jgi:hypothetical protein
MPDPCSSLSFLLLLLLLLGVVDVLSAAGLLEELLAVACHPLVVTSILRPAPLLAPADKELLPLLLLLLL